MPVTSEELLPTAKQLREKIAMVEAEEASKEAAKHAKAEAEKHALIEQLKKPSGISEDEAIHRALKIIDRAVGAGRTEVQVYRFPNILCSDHGRAINQQEPGWEETLTGLPREIYQFWAKYLQPRGYRLKVEIIDFPGGKPGDVGMTLKWD